MAITDITLLLIMLAGLICLHQHGGSTFGLAQFLWKQGITWILLATVAEIPPAVRLVNFTLISFSVIIIYVLGVDCFELEW